MPSIDAAFDLLASLASAGIIILAAFGLGRPIVRRLAIVEDEPLAVVVWSIAFGLVGAGSLLLALARVGLVDPVLVAALSSLGLLWSLVELACVYLGHVNGRVLVGVPCGGVTALGTPPRGAGLLCVPVGLALVTTMLLALAPPTSRETLSGSLEIPKLILLRHGLFAAELDSPPTNLAQMWTLWALALDGPVAANLVHWGIGLLAALATTLLARLLMSSHSAWLAGGLVLASPGVQSQLGVPLDDLAIALFAALGLCAVLRIWLYQPSGAWAIAGAVALGACTAIESVALSLVAAIVAVWIGVAWLRHDVVDLPWRTLGTLLMVATLVALPWVLAGSLDMPGPRQSAPSVLAHLGPCLCLAPSALVVARRLRGLKLLLDVGVVCAVLAGLGPWQGRWWSPLAPPAGVAAAWAWHEFGRLPRWAGTLVSCCLSLVVLGPAFSLWPRAFDSLAVATACQTRGDYLLAREPTFRAASLVNRISRADDRMLCQDDRMFYFDCQTRRQASEEPADETSSSDDALAEITRRARGQGFTYLLLAEPVDDSPNREAQFPQSAPASGSAANAASQLGPIGEVIPILEYRFADDNNRWIRYRLLRLAGSRDRIR